MAQGLDASAQKTSKGEGADARRTQRRLRTEKWPLHLAVRKSPLTSEGIAQVAIFPLSCPPVTSSPPGYEAGRQL